MTSKYSGVPCEVCGSPFNAYLSKGVRQRTCSRVCGNVINTRTGTVKYPSSSFIIATCIECETEFIKHHASRQTCSEHCAYARKKRQSREVQREKYGFKPAGEERQCYGCGESFNTKRSDQTLCGKNDNRCGEREERRLRKHVKRKESIPPSPLGSLVRCGFCLNCGEELTGRKLLWCSDSCSHTVSKRRAEHWHRSTAQVEEWATIGQWQVGERDDWTCYLCDGRIDRTAKSPEDWAMTIDCVISMSQGGEYALNNVRATHYLCNSLKGSLDGDQGRRRVLAHLGDYRVAA